MSPHDARCPTCAQVLGADNVCEHCRALSPMTRVRGTLVCSACDTPRARRPNTVVVSARELRWRAVWERLQLRVYRFGAAVVTLVNLFWCALFWAFASTALALKVTLVLALVTALVVALAYRRVARANTHRARRESFMLRQRLLGFAHKRGGAVTAEEVAAALGIAVADADALLDELVVTGKAEMEVTERGRIEFSLPAAPAASTTVPRAGVVAAQARRQRQ